MVELRAIGTLGLTSAAGAAFESVLAQPRRTALLCYLALARPRGYHSRDTVFALFWPEHDADHARHALRQSLYFLRRELGTEAIVSRGDGALMLDPRGLHCDVWEFDSLLEQGGLEQALALYRGDLLPGFHVSDAPDFERWLDEERISLRQRAAAAAWTLCEKEELAGNAISCASWGKRAAELSPADETLMRRLIVLLDRLGDRAAALRVYEDFVTTLARDYELEPSEETQALSARIRSGQTNEARHTRDAATRPREAGEISALPEQEPASDQRRMKPHARTRKRRAVAVGIGALILSSAIFIPSLRRPDARTAAANPSIAVLPFVSPSSDARDAALAHGMTEDLITKLAQAHKLRVISATSAFAFRNRHLDVRMLADSLDVFNVLEGSLQRTGDSLRVNVRLIDARDGTTQWSQLYSRAFHQIFAVQDEIVRSVAQQLDVPVGSASVKPRQPTPAYLLAHELSRQAQAPELWRSKAGRQRNFELFKRAIEADSTYAPAHAGLAHAYIQYQSDEGLSRKLKNLGLGEQEARKALVLDSSLASPYAALGRARLATYQFADAERFLRRAVELDPSQAGFREQLVFLYSFMGRRTQALEEARMAARVNPLDAGATVEVARALLVNDSCDAALKHLDLLERLDPPVLRVAPLSAQCYAQKQMWSTAIAKMQNMQERTPYGHALRAYLLARGGRTAEAISIRDSLLARARDGSGTAYPLALAYAGLGEFDLGIEWLERSIDDYSLHFTVMEPAFAELRRRPEFARIAKRVGIEKW